LAIARWAGAGFAFGAWGLNAGQHLIPLAEQLSDAFTLYLPDRRSRGLSPYADENMLTKESDNIEALVAHTGAERVFGHSVGGIVTCLPQCVSRPFAWLLFMNRRFLSTAPRQFDGIRGTLMRFDKVRLQTLWLLP